MRPVVTVQEMKAIDQEASSEVAVLVERAGGAVARKALRMLGSPYGRRVVTVAGKGNNDADGLVAARRLRYAGARVVVFGAAEAPPTLPRCDLVIDAAYGTGFRGAYEAPAPAGASRVLSVDIPSGVHGDTGEASDGAARADATVTFAALKPGLLLGEGPSRSGEVEVADIGLDVSRARIHAVDDQDVIGMVPRRARGSHKWTSAVAVVAGSHGMMGAASMSSHAAMRAGAGYARLMVPGAGPEDLPTGEVVASALPPSEWAPEVLEEAGRFRALVVGPGLGRSDATREGVRRLVAEADVPMVVDADGINVLGGAEELSKLAAGRRHPVVVTPHDGEFARLAGRAPGADRIEAARRLARQAAAVVLLKGPTTVVADPSGPVLLACVGSPRLATAGTGDVLSGMIGGFVARGLDAFHAAALGAHVHGRAASLGFAEGLVSGDLPELVASWMSSHLAGPAWPREPREHGDGPAVGEEEARRGRGKGA